MKNLIREGGKILTLRHMKIFTTVYRCGSVTRAAQELHLAQPSLSVAIRELEEQYGPYSPTAAAVDFNLHLLGQRTDHMMELNYYDRKRVHNLKYYTWVEQQGRTVEELNALWYDTEGTWDTVHAQAKDLDDLINAFNEEVGLLKTL